MSDKKKLNNMRLGMGKCPHCKQPLSSCLSVREEHIDKCDKNPKLWDGCELFGTKHQGPYSGLD